MKSSVTVMKVALLLLMLLLAVKADRLEKDNSFGTVEWQPKQLKKVTWNVSRPAAAYTTFMWDMDREVRLTTTTSPSPVWGLPVLSKWKAMTRDNWIQVTLQAQGRQGRMESALAIRADNLYLAGFRTQAGHWYTFKKKGHLIPGSTALDYIEDIYQNLTGSNYRALNQLVLSRGSTQASVELLANYVHGSTDKDQLRTSLLRFVVMVCEAARIKPMHAGVTAALAQDVGATVGNKPVALTVKWRFISCALVGSSKENGVLAPEGLGTPLSHPWSRI